MKIYHQFPATVKSTLPAKVSSAAKGLALAVFCLSSSGYASEPYQLDLQQLHSVTAGSAPELAASVEGTADAVSNMLVLTGVKTRAEADSRVKGKIRLDSVYASGVSYACCEGGTSSLEIEVSSNAQTQVGFVRVFSLESSLMSAKIGAGAIIGFTRL